LPSTHHSELWTAKEVEKHIIDIDALRTCEAVLLPEKFSSQQHPAPQQKKNEFCKSKIIIHFKSAVDIIITVTEK